MSDLVKLYNETLSQAIFNQLPSVFPEFGWELVNNGYEATNDEYTKNSLGVAARRVTCKKPTGIYIHGHDTSVRGWMQL